MKFHACGYEKIGYQNIDIPENVVLYKSGKKKGEIKTIHPPTTEYLDIDSDKEDFIRIGVEKGFEFVSIKEDRYFRDEIRSEVEVFACPQCGTLRIEV